MAGNRPRFPRRVCPLSAYSGSMGGECRWGSSVWFCGFQGANTGHSCPRCPQMCDRRVSAESVHHGGLSSDRVDWGISPRHGKSNEFPAGLDEQVAPDGSHSGSMQNSQLTPASSTPAKSWDNGWPCMCPRLGSVSAKTEYIDITGDAGDVVPRLAILPLYIFCSCMWGVSLVMRASPESLLTSHPNPPQQQRPAEAPAPHQNVTTDKK